MAKINFKILRLLILGLWFAMSYGLATISTLALVNKLDEGQTDLVSFQFMGMSGLIFGSIAFWIESYLYSQVNHWPENIFLYLLRVTIMSSIFIALSFTLGGMAFVIWQERIANLTLYFFIFLLAMLCWPLFSPIGLLLAIINTIVLRVITFRGNNKTKFDSSLSFDIS